MKDSTQIPGQSLTHTGVKKFLFEKPELLTLEHHGSLGLTTLQKPFSHVKTVRAIPLTTTEFSSAQRRYPIIFSNLKDPVIIAAVGLAEGLNLFVDDNGGWEPECYIPSYLRCHPFAFATDDGGSMAVVVDRAAESVTENAEHPFFIDGKVSTRTNALMDFCAQYDAERKRTKEYCDRLVELDLLVALRATYVPKGSDEEKILAEYVSVDIQKLNELDSDTIFELHKSGWLSAIYLQHYSIENWRYLRAKNLKKAA